MKSERDLANLMRLVTQQPVRDLEPKQQSRNFIDSAFVLAWGLCE